MQLSPKQQKLLKVASVPLFYGAALLVFVRLTFPYETLKNRIEAEYNSSQKEKRLEIAELSGSGLLGVEAKGVKMSEVSVQMLDGKPVPRAQLLIERVSVGVSPLSYLFGTISVDFDSELGGGELNGSFIQNDEEARISIVADSIDVSEVTLLSSSLGLPLGGELKGKVELFLPLGQMKKAEGTFDLAIDQLSVGDGKAKIRDTIALPKINAGNLVFKAEAADGRLEISEFSADGRDFKLDAEGKMRLREPFEKSSLNLNATFAFKEAYTNKSDLTKSLFGSKDSKVPALFDMDPSVRRAKGADGSYSWQVTGLLSNPNFRPGRKSKPSSSKKKK